MFTNTQAFSSFSVDDLDKAEEFYGSMLGIELDRSDEMGSINLWVAGETSIYLYFKENHQAATFTVLNFIVDDIDAAVKELKSKGISLEHYKIPELKQDKQGISRGETISIAWFTDPAGNILSLIQQ